MNQIPEGMKALMIDIAAVLYAHSNDDYLASERTAVALLAPDGPLWPALRALGTLAGLHRDTWFFFDAYGISDSLAAACLAAAEVEP